MNELKNNILSIIKELYCDRLDERQLNAYASNLEFCLKNSDDLTEIFSVAYENEFECEIEDSQAGLVFTEVRNLLVPSEETANRLYECFMGSYDGFDIAMQLFNENYKYLSKEQLILASEKAVKLYDVESAKLLFNFKDTL